jgi:hypothetical protein
MKQDHWEDLVPATKIEGIQKAFQCAFGTLMIDDLAPLFGGRSSALVYKVTVNQKAYVMRLVLQGDALTDPRRHFVALNAAASKGIAPRVHYTNVEDAISIVDFVEHVPLPATSWFSTEGQLFRELATRIQAIHSLPLFPRFISFLDGVDHLIQSFKTSGLLPAEAMQEHFRHYAAIQRFYPRDEQDLVSSHNDFNPTNVLFSGGKIWIIDWEVAFANDRYVDLACANIFFGAGERGEETLLSTYFGGALNDYHRARFFLMQQVCFMYIAMLFMHLTLKASREGEALTANTETVRLQEFHRQLREGRISLTSPREFLLYARVMLNESLLQMKTTRFTASIAALSR